MESKTAAAGILLFVDLESWDALLPARRSADIHNGTCMSCRLTESRFPLCQLDPVEVVARQMLDKSG